MKLTRRRKILGALFTAAILLGVTFVWNIGGVLVAPANRPVGSPPPGLHAQSVEFPSASGATIHGWLVPGQPGKGVVVLMHGIHANRLSLVARGEFLSRAGYSVLLLIFKATAKASPKPSRSVFWKAATRPPPWMLSAENFPAKKSASLAFRWARRRRLLAEPPLPVSAMVLESSYPTIYQAAENRMAIRFGFLGKLATPLLTCQLKPRLGVGLDDLKPIDHAGKISVPKFFIAGTADRDTTQAESQALFAAAAEPKQLWLLDGAAHASRSGSDGREPIWGRHQRRSNDDETDDLPSNFARLRHGCAETISGVRHPRLRAEACMACAAITQRSWPCGS